MENNLEINHLGLDKEKKDFLDFIKQKEEAISNYLTKLSLAIQQTKDLKDEHRNSIVLLSQEKQSLDDKIALSKVEHEDVKRNTEKITNEAEEKRTKAEMAVVSLTSQVEKLNKVINALMIEKKSIDEEVSNGRAQASMFERKFVETKNELNEIDQEITTKRTIVGDLNIQEEDLRKKIAEHNNNEAILLARKK